MQLSGNTVACWTRTESHTLLLRNWVTHLLHLQLAQQCHMTIEIQLGYLLLNQQCQRINFDLCDLCATTVSITIRPGWKQSPSVGLLFFSFMDCLSKTFFLLSFFCLSCLVGTFFPWCIWPSVRLNGKRPLSPHDPVSFCVCDPEPWHHVPAAAAAARHSLFYSVLTTTAYVKAGSSVPKQAYVTFDYTPASSCAALEDTIGLFWILRLSPSRFFVFPPLKQQLLVLKTGSSQAPLCCWAINHWIHVRSRGVWVIATNFRHV